MPIRIQRKRTKGWRMPEGAVYVGRPSKWGNPFEVGTVTPGVGLAVPDRQTAVLLYKDLVIRHDRLLEAEAVLSLRGKNLACWCGLWYDSGERILCHADILMELANEGYTTPTHREDMYTMPDTEISQ